MKRIFIFWFLIFICSGNIALGQSSKSYLRKGNKKYENKNYAEAKTNYRKALTEDSAYAKATYNMANTLYREKRYKDAAFNYSKLLKNPKELPDSVLKNVYYNMGNAYLQEFLQGNKNEKDPYKNLNQSIDAYKNALRISPKDQDAKYNLSYALKLRPKQEEKEKKKQQEQEQKQKEHKQSEAEKIYAKAQKLVKERKYHEAYDLMKKEERNYPELANYKDFTNRIYGVIKML